VLESSKSGKFKQKFILAGNWPPEEGMKHGAITIIAHKKINQFSQFWQTFR